MSKPATLIIYLTVSFCLFLSSICIEHVNNYQEIVELYDRYSFKPLLHLFFNSHFKKSKNFIEFETTVQELINIRGDYMDVAYTDCEADQKGSKLRVCDELREKKMSHKIYGTLPSDYFRKIGDLEIQQPPQSRSLSLQHQTYPVQGLSYFMDSLLPNFFTTLNNFEEYQEFLEPKYSPKLILFGMEDEQIANVYKKISINYALRYDLAFVSDLSEQITQFFTIKKYPTLAIVKYNYQTKKNEIQYFTEESQNNQEEYYRKIKKFADKFALKEIRNDRIFHKLVKEEKSEIYQAKSEGDLNYLKSKLKGWLVIYKSEGDVPLFLKTLEEKYDRFFNYIHYATSQPLDKRIEVFSTMGKRGYEVTEEQLFDFQTLSAEKMMENIYGWLKKDFILLIVREKNGYTCGIIEKPLFRGNVQCQILKEGEEEQLEKLIGGKMGEGGVVVRNAYDSDKKTQKAQASLIPEIGYDKFYDFLEKITRQQITEKVKMFTSNPVSEVEEKTALRELCDHPTKQCMFFVTDLSKKDRTLHSYLISEALNYLNSFLFFEVDYDSNPEFIKAIGGPAEAKRGDLVVFSSRKSQFTRLRKNITKILIQKFLKANLKHDSRLKPTKIDEGVLESLSISPRAVAKEVDSQEL